VLANFVLYVVWWWNAPSATVLDQLAGDPRRAPWSLVTFILLEPGLLFGWFNVLLPVYLIVLFWLGGDLEWRWGSKSYAGFVAGSSAVSYLAVYTVTGHALTGPAPVLANMTMAWITLHPDYQLRVMFMFTLRPGFFRWCTLALVLLSSGFYARFLPGLSSLAGPLLSWWWASRIATASEKPRFVLIQGGRLDPGPTSFEETEIDRILDKIAREGLAALSAQERDLLDSKSRQLRRD
jgi:hypothetical protein